MLTFNCIVPLDDIPREQKRFTSTPHFLENGTAWLDPFDPALPWPDNVQYVGDPSPEIDANWEKLIQGRYFSISAEEARGIWGESYHEYVDETYGGYTAG